MSKNRAVTGCTGKKRYWKFSKALDARSILANQYPNKRFEVYQCWCCGKWHVGTVRKYDPYLLH